MTTSDRPTDPAPSWAADGHMGDPVLYLIDRVSNLSDALVSDEGLVAQMRKEAKERHDSVMMVLKSIADRQLVIEAKITGLEDAKDKHENRIHAVEIHHHSNGNGASK